MDPSLASDRKPRTMPYYDVHLYQAFRLEFAGIEAVDPVAAIRAALNLRPEDAQECEDAEGCPTDALVDRLYESGSPDDDSHEYGLNFDLVYGEEWEPRILPAIDNTPMVNRPAAAVPDGNDVKVGQSPATACLSATACDDRQARRHGPRSPRGFG